MPSSAWKKKNTIEGDNISGWGAYATIDRVRDETQNKHLITGGQQPQHQVECEDYTVGGVADDHQRDVDDRGLRLRSNHIPEL